ncbi:TPA: hypothetical protein ACH3X1_006696 [Trebouxia sp. C0004]
MKNASLQELIDGEFGQTGPKLYATAGNLINQAVLGFTETTSQFKTQQQLPRHISIPDIGHAGPGDQMLCRDMPSEVCQ